MSSQDQSFSVPQADFPLAGWSLAGGEGISAKRLLDLAGAGAVLILLLPLLALIALLIVLDSRGPVFFVQHRIGRGGKSFAIFKFRTMHVLENGTEIRQAGENDPRVTRVGRPLRALSLDELPQLINVLKGEMSLVGPRPHARAHDEFYDARIANYHLRRLVKPGITGWAQIHGRRGATPTLADMQARIDLDQFYVENECLGLDLHILARTPLAVLSGRNAC